MLWQTYSRSVLKSAQFTWRHQHSMRAKFHPSYSAVQRPRSVIRDESAWGTRLSSKQCLWMNSILLTDGYLHAPVVIKEVMFILSNLYKLVCLNWSERKLGFSRLKNILENFMKQSGQPVALTAYCDFVWWHVNMILCGSPYYDWYYNVTLSMITGIRKKKWSIGC